ncbi:Fic family protein [Ruficoccus sp. ZRK36]|uniref:Fic/DOC family protein n=1 Tax=Ruficoccus sp. ZRK36 TaxID=2866311 RepID=UPI001C736C01|nr:Fic family protein [Ruficoccus sp. ZRK36]QYY37411.1 Fic family protein [Ruficoccus sp. ZRK36]
MSVGKYQTSAGIEGEYQPGSRKRVLRNLLGITSKQAMDEAEFEALIGVQDCYLDGVTEDTVFTANLLRQMHREWLGSIYEWAGSYRTVEMSKAGFTWPPAFRVAANMESFERDILRKMTPFRLEGLDAGCVALAQVHAEFLLIHPFREGNGRMARWLTDLMCLQAGLPQPEYGFVGRGSRQNQQAYLQGVIRGYEQDYRALADFFQKSLERSTTR